MDPGEAQYGAYPLDGQTFEHLGYCFGWEAVSGIVDHSLHRNARPFNDPNARKPVTVMLHIRTF